MRTLYLFLLFAITIPASAQQFHRAAIDSMPSKIPDRIVLSWSDDPTTTASINWRTDTTILEAQGQIAEASASANFTTWAETENALTEPWENNGHKAHFHSVTFKRLKPNTLYAYRVGSGNIWSSWYQFRTASTKPQDFSFIYFGDAQNNLLSLWARTIRMAYADAPKADFIIHAGDLVNTANKDSDWAEWFASGSFIHAQVPAIPTPGNHEAHKISDKKRELSILWRPHFTLPKNGPKGLEETVYYIDYQGARIISLNSNSYANPEGQVEWLENTLKNNPNKWTFVTYHHPLYSASKNRDNKKLRETWKPLFDKYAVDLVLQGHDHSYARGQNLGDGITVKDPNNGTVYVVSVSGPKQYKLSDSRWMTRASENTQLYQVISVYGNTLSYRAMTAVGELYDAFDLIKQEGKPNKLIERGPETPERRWENTLEKKDPKTKVY